MSLYVYILTTSKQVNLYTVPRDNSQVNKEPTFLMIWYMCHSASEWEITSVIYGVNGPSNALAIYA